MGDFPALSLGCYPTPLEKLENLSKKYGVQFYVKREDLSGPGFGGNKVRKLRYLLAEALKRNATHVLTYGAHQTNHGRETAACCRKLGIKPLLFLLSPSEELMPLGNLILNCLMDCEIHMEPLKPKNNVYESLQRLKTRAEERILEIERLGGVCYEIPAGGMNPLGCLGYTEALIEIQEQAKQAGFIPDYIAHASGTGGTLSGLLSGVAMIGSSAQILSFSVDQEPENKTETIIDHVTAVLKMLGHEPVDEAILVKQVQLISGYFGEGYERPTSGAADAIKELAVEEGLFLDPVYTGKAMYGLLELVKKKTIPPESRVIFLHTGGGPALFAERDITGFDFLDSN